MTTKPEWERLADALEAPKTGCTCFAHYYGECCCDNAVWPEMSMKPAAAELRQLGQDAEGYKFVIANSIEALRKNEEQLAKQAEQLKAVTHLVTQLHNAKGHHRDRAMLALFDAFGLSNTKPEKTK